MDTARMLLGAAMLGGVAVLGLGRAQAQGVTVDPGGAIPALGQEAPGIGPTGNAFSFTSLTVADFATITLGSGSFAENGYLNVTGAVDGSSSFTPTGLGGTTSGGGETSGLYTLYLQFSASGTLDAPNFNQPSGTFTGNFTTLTYTLYGVNGQSSFGFAGTTPEVTNSAAPIVLATGELTQGGPANEDAVMFSQAGTPSPGSQYEISPSATGVGLSWLPNTAESGFFVSPPATETGVTLSANLTADPGVVTEVNSQTIEIDNGRGTLTPTVPAATEVPEPGSLGLLAAALGGLGLARRRRRK